MREVRGVQAPCCALSCIHISLIGAQYMIHTIEFSTAELLEIEEALQAADNENPAFQAAIESANFKVGFALERPWALNQAKGDDQ